MVYKDGHGQVDSQVPVSRNKFRSIGAFLNSYHGPKCTELPWRRQLGKGKWKVREEMIHYNKEK